VSAEIVALPEKQSAVDNVVDQIRELIREEGLTVGDVLPSEADLSSRFGAGRNTVREAVRTLKAYGLVDSRQKVGAVLTDRVQEAMSDLFSLSLEISVDRFADIQGFRRLTEMNLADNLVGKISAEALARMVEANERMVAASDVVEASGFDFLFHQIMIEAAGNRTLTGIYAMLRPVVRKLMESGKSQRTARDAAAREHLDIVEALRSGDRIDFLYHMNRHLSAGLQFIPDARKTKREPL
jgi:GntR family transcriptional regulator, transcriptional repressor for pyruvate dehydrogenase complex